MSDQLTTLAGTQADIASILPSIGSTIISVSDHLYQTKNLSDQTLEDMLSHILTGAVAGQIAVIRAVQTDTANTHEIQESLSVDLDRINSITPQPEQRAALAAARAAYLQDPHDIEIREEIVSFLKTGLAGIMFSGRFSQRGNKYLLKHSRLICIDLDDVTDPAAMIAEINADPYCLAAFLSPSGTGVKIIFIVPETDAQGHRERTFPAIKAYLVTKFGVTVDKSACEVARVCYISHDPAMVINLDALEFPVPDEAASTAHASPSPQQNTPLTSGEDYNLRGNVAALLTKHGWTSSDDINWTRPGKESGISATLGVVQGPPNCLWVFSSNAAPFTPLKRYEPWRVFALLECGGDDATAFGKLAELGYGSKESMSAESDTFLILPSALGLTITDSAKKIFPAIATGKAIFVRGGKAHEVATAETGMRLQAITPGGFRSRLEKYGQLMAWRATSTGRTLSPAICSEATAKALLETTEACDLLPGIKVIISSPALAMDGDELVVLKRGWNPQNGGVFVAGGTVPPEVQLDEAIASLLGLLGDFDFQSYGDVARAIASLITPAMKAGGLLTSSTPIEVCEADKSQAGKGFLRKLVAAIYAEVTSFVAQKEGGVGSLDEAIASALVTGRPFIQLDNLRGNLRSACLEAMLTADGLFPCRVPHVGTVEVDVRPFTFAVTSNGVQTTRDLANRSSIVRIKKRPQGYGFHVFPEGGLLEHVQARQPYYLGCVFAIVREWVKQGKPRTNECRHDFRTWAQSLDWITTNIFGGACSLMDGHSEARDRVSDQGRSWLRAVALKLAEAGRLDQEIPAEPLADLSGDNDIPIPNSRPDASDLGRSCAVGKVMAKLFSEGDVVPIEGFTVYRSMNYTKSADKKTPHYRFSPN